MKGTKNEVNYHVCRTDKDRHHLSISPTSNKRNYKSDMIFDMKIRPKERLADSPL